MYDYEQNIKYSVQCSDDVETDDNATYDSGYIYRQENESTSSMFNRTGCTKQSSTARASSDWVREIDDYIPKSANQFTEDFTKDSIQYRQFELLPDPIFDTDAKDGDYRRQQEFKKTVPPNELPRFLASYEEEPVKNYANNRDYKRHLESKNIVQLSDPMFNTDAKDENFRRQQESKKTVPPSELPRFLASYEEGPVNKYANNRDYKRHMESKNSVQPRGPPGFLYQEEPIHFPRTLPLEYIPKKYFTETSSKSKSKQDMGYQVGASKITTHNQGNDIPNLCITGDNLKINDINKSQTDIPYSYNHVNRPIYYNIPAIHSIETNAILDTESNISSHIGSENNQYGYVDPISNSHYQACATNEPAPVNIPSDSQSQRFTISKHEQMVQRGLPVCNSSAGKEPESAYFRRPLLSSQVDDLIQSSGEESSNSFGTCSDEEQQSRCQGPACGEKGIPIYKNLCSKCYNALLDANGYYPLQNSKPINSCIGPLCPNAGEKILKRLCKHCFNILSTIQAKEDKNILQPIISRPENISGQFRTSQDIPWNIYYKSKPPERTYLIPRSNNDTTNSPDNPSSTSRNHHV